MPRGGERTTGHWQFEAEYIQSCNCDYGCPCNFNGYPTYGSCEALVGYRIRKGTFGSTSLDGATFAQALWWPKAIHEGNGIARTYVDSRATPAQTRAIDAIASGRAGGGIFAIFAKTFRTVYPMRRTKIDFSFHGPTSWFKVDGIGEVHSDSIRNPVTGEAFRGEVVLPNGLQWKRAEVTRIVKWWMVDDEIVARHENRSGFVSVIRMDQTGCIG